MSEEGQNYFRKCSSCKKEINFGKAYFACEVTSCKKHAFCSVDCWNIHNEIMGHKSAGAIEQRAPLKSAAPIEAPRETRRIVVDTNREKPATGSLTENTSMDKEILIVASKLKQYVKEKYDLNTSANVMEILSDIVRRESDRACVRAMQEGRKTLMDRDF